MGAKPFKELWNGISWGLDFTWGNFVVAPTNLLLTGRAWNTTWDTDTTEGLITFVAAAAAGAGCLAASGGNPVVAGMCAGAVAGGFGSAFAGERDPYEIIVGGAVGGAVFGGISAGPSFFANVAVFRLTGSHIAADLAAVAASSGHSIGRQQLMGGDVNWAQVSANGAVAVLAAWYRGAAKDAADAAYNQEVGEAAGASAAASAAAAGGHGRVVATIFLHQEYSAVTGCFPFCATNLNPFYDYPAGFTEAYLQGTSISSSFILTAGAAAELLLARGAATVAVGATSVQVGSGVAQVAAGYGARNAQIFARAVQIIKAEGSAGFTGHLGALARSVAEAVPKGQVWKLGEYGGQPIFGAVRNGLGIVESGGQTLVVHAPQGGSVTILGALLP